ncbi:hypothetical protein A2841_01840 [Candidatus Kaiserbacteria bacterium RIFCSPHIGHO2_01_FULL_48_10]|uniref:DUF5667 domain-containing protein n=1 Tax=Candidatus Kaiserbacteria bacterium RIFCSPHIGHO2_01_FULL_48_10 TaxID=1798476 RepID=A0A1F6C5E9_9BACT|nr:MAG: hypothetical protein A2841_01840 [Candidatus Kaiserbacteria bacterium RIFCSPHIGHO2_01_FULL_48_10]
MPMTYLKTALPVVVLIAALVCVSVAFAKGEAGERASEVSTRVQLLLNVADRDQGIGEEVRVIAHEYASSSERMEEVRAEVESRPTWRVLLLGSDYRNLGKLRSEIVTTENQIDRLEKARDRATDPAIKADLTAQITALEDSASTTMVFVKENESKFSLFGWLVRLFAD